MASSVIDYVIASARLANVAIGRTGRSALSPTERDVIAMTIAGEIDPRFSPYGLPSTTREIASILEVVETRHAINKPGAFGKTGLRDPVTGKIVGSVRDGYRNRAEVALQQAQFSTWNNKDFRATARANMAKFGPQINSAIDAYYAGRAQPAVKNATHYWNPEVVTPHWSRSVTAKKDLGPHRFAKHPSLAPRNAFEDKPETLKEGVKGKRSDVTALQNSLAALGFDPGPVDGVYGKATADAVKSAQEALGLTVDGIAGPETQNTINATLAASVVQGVPASQFADPTVEAARGVPAAASLPLSKVEARTATPGRSLPAVAKAASRVSQEMAKEQARDAIRQAVSRPEPAQFAPAAARTSALEAIDRQFGLPTGKASLATTTALHSPISVSRTSTQRGTTGQPALADPAPLSSRPDLAADMKAASRMGTLSAPSLFDPATAPGARGLTQTPDSRVSRAFDVADRAQATPATSAVAQAEAERDALAAQVGSPLGARSAIANQHVEQAAEAARSAPVDPALGQALADRAGRARSITGLPSFGDVAAARHDIPSTMDPALGIPTAQTMAGLEPAAPVTPATTSPADRINQAFEAVPGALAQDVAQSVVEQTAPLTQATTQTAAPKADRLSATPAERISQVFGVVEEAPEAIQVSRPPSSPAPRAPAPDRSRPTPTQTAKPATPRTTPREFTPAPTIGRPHALETSRATARDFASDMAMGRSFGFSGRTGIHSVDTGLTARDAALAGGRSRADANYNAWSAFEASAPKTGWARETEIAQMSRSMALANNMGRSQNQAAALSAAQAAGPSAGGGTSGVSTGTSSAGAASTGKSGGGIQGGPGSVGHTGHDDTGPGSGSSGGSDPKVLCTYFNGLGWLPTRIYRGEALWSLRNVDERTRAAYRFWAKPLIRLMEGHAWLRAPVFKAVVEPWAYEAAYLAGKHGETKWWRRAHMAVFRGWNRLLASLLSDEALDDEWFQPA